MSLTPVGVISLCELRSRVWLHSSGEMQVESNQESDGKHLALACQQQTHVVADCGGWGEQEQSWGSDISFRRPLVEDGLSFLRNRKPVQETHKQIRSYDSLLLAGP